MKTYFRLVPPIVGVAMLCLMALVVWQSVTANVLDELWEDIDATALRPSQERVMPQVFRALRLDAQALDQLLARAPRESADSSSLVAESPVELSVPLPDGGFTRFRIVESSIMEPALAVQFPQLKTYSGQGIDDPTATMRADRSPRGFHVLVLSERGAIYVDPYKPDDQSVYLSYYTKDYHREEKAWNCSVFDREAARVEATTGQALTHSGTTRTYRLAVAATGEYSQFHGGTVDRALAAIVTTINRVNTIYQRDLAVRFTLVADEARIIYTNPSNDPYTNNDGQMLLRENQANLDAVIGSNNYDVGHVFSTAGGGYGTLQSVCNNSRKAMGETGSSAPIGDPFDVDYVAHELGHQFGGDHTFNGATKSCSGNRWADTAYEPGSGSTIMGYAGICGEQDLQPHTDPYFHVKSLEEITSFITAGGGSTCGVLSGTSNAPPSVNAGQENTIPARTPFTLRATGNDPEGQPLTFAWEQYDLGSTSPPDTDDGFRPIFRSFVPRAEPMRTFPRLADILEHRETYGESLPLTSRRLTFQVTARDNQVQGGAISSALTHVNVQASGGPFVVTQPQAAINWAAGSTQTVTWNVANTNVSPINCANVKISLSTDGGQTFSTVLADNTPNDGNQNIVVPNVTTSAARIKVEAVGNIFFDISPGNFTITGGGSGGSTIALTSGVPQTGSIPAPSQSGQAVISPTQYTIQVPSGTTQLRMELSDNQDVDLYVRFGQPVTFTNGAVQADFISESPTGHETITISPSSSPPLQVGTYYLAVANYGPNAANFTLMATVTAPSNPPPVGNRVVRVGQAGGSPGGIASVPIELIAQGDENAIGFSLTFNPAMLSNPQANLGTDAAGATLNNNTSQVGSGRLGIALSLPFGQKFGAGTRQIVVVNFAIAGNATGNSTPIEFGDQPIGREISDVSAHALQASYTPGMVVSASGLEADVAPRPNGNGSVTVTDWVQIGRFVAGQDTPSPGEFQHADCAPRDTRGNGTLTVTDWVQAGRYAAGLDAITSAGGPNGRNPLATLLAQGLVASTPRNVSISNDYFERGHRSSVMIELDGQGNENALGFTLAFNPSQLQFVSAVVGKDAFGATLNVNASQTSNGLLGVALALPSGQAFPAGQRQAIVINFAVTANAEATTTISFSDQVVARELSDANANSLSVNFSGGLLTLARKMASASMPRFGSGKFAAMKLDPELYNFGAMGK